MSQYSASVANCRSGFIPQRPRLGIVLNPAHLSASQMQWAICCLGSVDDVNHMKVKAKAQMSNDPEPPGYNQVRKRETS